MATSKFIRYFQMTTGGPLIGAAIWLVPQADTYPTNALQLTPHGTKAGVYYRDNVEDGEYKIYIDPTGGSSPTLDIERYWIGEQRLTDFMKSINSDVTTYDVSISKHGLVPKLPNNPLLFLNGQGGYTAPPTGIADQTADYTWTGRHAFNKIIQLGGVLRVDLIDPTNDVDVSTNIVIIMRPLGAGLTANIINNISNQMILLVNASNIYDLTINGIGVLSSGESCLAIYDSVNSLWITTRLTLSDNLLNDVSTLKHGFCPKLPNDATKFLSGAGTWLVPTGSGSSTSVNYFPTGGVVYRDYKDIIPSGEGYAKELLPPRPDPATAGYQTAEFEDCSEMFRPIVLEVGDFYYLYYIGSTQKYKTDIADLPADRAKSDFQRNNQIFLAWKHKNQGVCGGGWQKYKGGRVPVIPIDTNIYGGGKEVGRVWLRSIIWSTILNKYICAYNCDADYTGSNHQVWWAFAESTDGINWTKKNTYYSFPGVGTAWGTGALIEVGNYFYLYTSTYGSQHIDLFRSRDLINWTLVKNTIIPTATGITCWGARVWDGKIYLIVNTTDGSGSSVNLVSCDQGSVEFAEGYIDSGVLYSGSFIRGEDNSGAVNWTDIFKADVDKWVIFYNYYKDRYARYDVVREVGIRQLSFGASFPHPTAAAPNYPPSFSASKTIDEQVISSTVLQNDDHLVLTGLAAGTYQIRLDISGNHTASGAGIKLTIVAPAGTTISGSVTRTTSSSTTWATDPIPGLTVLASNISWGAIGDHYVIVTGTLVLTTAGDVIIKWAENTAAGTMTFKQLSSLTLVKTA